MSRAKWGATGRALAVLLLPSLVLVAPLSFYAYFGGLPHFALHMLMGWDTGLLLLLAASLADIRRRSWEGVLPVLLALLAMTPDFIFVAGPYHRDWMDIFLFHVSLDEILPWAVVILLALWLVLLTAYRWFRVVPRYR